MKPAPFEYHRPGTLEEALELLSAHGGDAKPLAGGQSLLPAMNFRLARPAVLVDLGAVAALRYLRTVDGSLAAGAMTRHVELERSAEVARAAPLVSEAMPHVAHPQIRNRGTLGGSLAHADPAAELPAVMAAIGARYRVASVRGERWIAAAGFVTGLFATALEPDELLVGVEVPVAGPRAGYAFLEMARRHGDYALVGVAAVVVLDEAGLCSGAEVTLVSVGDGPVRSGAASRALLGREPTPQVVREAAEAVDGDIAPPSDIHASAGYRRHLARVLSRRALETAAGRARRPGGAADEGRHR